MEISNAHHQAMVSHQLEEVLGGCPNGGQQQQQQQERKARPQPEQALRCPRCDSTNTKFCYYNNYSLSQPRYFCKACRRYWTQGGSLRNVPVGGGCRKNKRSSSSSSSSSSKKAQQDQSFTNPNPLLPPPMPPLSYDPSDLTLAFARLHNHPTTPRPLGLDDHHDQMFFLGNPNPNPNPSNIPTGAGFIDILRGGFLDSTTTTTTTTTPPSSFHNFYYGFGGGGGAHVEEVGGGGLGGELVLPFEEAASSSQGGPCKAMDGGEGKLLMGLQWPLGGEGGMSVDSSREYSWNGPSWHGLINSSMM